MEKNYTLYNGNCLEVLKTLPDNSVDSIVTDPPYGLSFMGKKWDYDVPSQEIWEEALRVLKPGGYLLAFAGTRTQHRMAVRIEDAGFEIRDMIAWVYGSGFPKSLDISKAIDKSAGAEREVISETKTNSGGMAHISKTNAEHGFRPNADTGNSEDKSAKNVIRITAPATDEAKQWEGWGTALKPALEPITVARKPLEENTVAANVLKYGTGGINIDESRIPTNPEVDDPRLGGNGSWKTDGMAVNAYGKFEGTPNTSSPKGRFPANFIHDGSEEVVSLFPNTKAGGSVSGKEPSKTGDENTNCYGEYNRVSWDSYNDDASAARFFYCAKTSKKDRNEGLEDFEAKSIGGKGNGIRRICSKCGASSLEAHTCLCEEKDWVNPPTKKNNHPTVKPTDLMRYLVRMVTPKGGTVLDPFMGSGSTGKGAMLEGFKFVGIELDPDYMEIAKARIEFANPEDEMFDEVVKTEVKEVDNLFEF
jgi:site-specific DNA-methyltransferase (adenine-specific)